jgi:hypothetical protein
MSFDSATRNRLASFVAQARKLLCGDYNNPGGEITSLLQTYGIQPDGTIAALDDVPGLDQTGYETGKTLREIIEHKRAQGAAKKAWGKYDTAVYDLLQEQSFTVLNRLCAVRMAEERGIILPSIAQGTESDGFQLFEQVTDKSRFDRDSRYQQFLFSIFDELALDLRSLFDRFSPQGLLFPRAEALGRLLDLLNSPDLAALWKEDETIGWIYQYWNSQEERKAMREASAAPRNSREMAVRNQFFTPRYVVEFLNDNSLGRLWQEMTKGCTALKDRCRYLIRRPCEFFLPDPGECSLPDTYGGRRGMLRFWETGNPFDLPENPDVDVVIDWLCRLRQSGFESELQVLGTDHQAVMDRWFMPVEQGNPPADLADAHPVILMHCLWRVGVQIERTGHDDMRRPVADDLWASHLWSALRQQLLHPPEGLSKEDTLKRPVFVPHRPLKDPREIRVIDPACGSMHFGLYAFDLLTAIYEEAWDLQSAEGTASSTDHRSLITDHSEARLTDLYPSKDEFMRDIPRLIVEHNIHGIDIDPRATQIAGLSLWLRAQRAWADQRLQPGQRPVIRRSRIVCAEPMPGEKDLLREFVDQQFPTAERGAYLHLLESVFDLMQLAGEAGSLLRIEEDIRGVIADAKQRWKTGPRLEQVALFEERPRGASQAEMSLDLSGITDEQFWERAEERIYQALHDFAENAGGGYQRRLFADDAAHGFAFIDLCRQRYDVALMNPPFGDASLPSKPYIEASYGDTKGDVYKAFVECFQARLVPAGYLGIISSRTGFFLGQSEDWRTRVVLRLFRPIALADLGSGVLDAMVEVAAYVLRSLSEPEARDLTLSLVPDLENVIRDTQDRFSLPKWQSVRDGLKRHQAAAELQNLEAHGFIQRSPGDIVRYTPLWSAVKKISTPTPRGYPSLVCVKALATDDKERVLGGALSGLEDRNLFVCDPGSFMALPGRTFGYWVSEKVRQLFMSMPLFRDNDDRLACITNPAGDDTRYFRCFWEPPEKLLGRAKRWASLAKGGEFSRYYADQHLVVSWDDEIGSYTGFLGTPHRPLIRPASCAHFFRPGFTYSRRSQKGFSVRALPAGTIFHDKGPGIFAPNDELLPLLAVFNSSVFSSLLALQMAFGSYEVGVIQRTPMPSSFGEFSVPLGSRALRLWRERRNREEALATSHAFICSALLFPNDPTLSERAAAWAARERTSDESAVAIQAEIDDLAFRLYGLDDADRAALTATLATVDTDSGTEEQEDEEAAPADAPALTADLLAYVLGCAFGRWDIRFATGERPAPEPPDPFDPLPVCPPGMLQNGAGLPAATSDVPSSYPLRITWPGILVDDEASEEDIERRTRDVLAVLFPDRADAITEEACTLLGVKSLRDWFRKPTGFFADHLKRYSKSRRQAPIYWPLSTPSGNYTLWLYYPRLTRDTLYSAVTQFVEPKIADCQSDLAKLHDKGDARNKQEDKRYEQLVQLIAELSAFREELLRIAAFWKPDLNDGVQITAAPLWQFFRLPKWQKTLKDTWQKLEAGEYDWAHLAHSIWPKRVIPKCAEDRSLAIAHGHDAALWEEVTDKKGKTTWKPKPDAKEIAATLIANV